MRSSGDAVPIEAPRTYSIEVFCSVYGIGRTAVYNELKSGRLVGIKVGARRLISVNAAEAWLRAKEQEVAA
jgi:hypothetical protein